MKVHRVLLCWSLAVAAVTPLSGADFNQALTAQEVLCDSQQLERLAFRFTVSEINPKTPAATNPSLLLWRHSSGGPSFEVLGVTDGVRDVTGPGPIRDERQLSAELVIGEEGDVLDPRRPLLPHAVLTRRNQNSNLAADSREFLLTITMDAAPEVPDPTHPKIPLIVNNLINPLRGERPRPVADALGRGLLTDGLTTSCHSKLTTFDERIFRILSRTLRTSVWFTRLGYDPANPTAWNIVLFRGEDPHLYRGTIYGYLVTCRDDGSCPFQRHEPAELEFVVNWDEQGRLTNGEIRLIPGVDSGRISIFVLPPMRPGRDRQTTELNGAPFLLFNYLGDPSNILTAPVHWGELLETSRWND